MDDVFDSKVIREIKDDATWDELVNKAKNPVMVEFFVTWCPHCQREAPILDEVAPAIMADGIDVYHANAEVMYDKGPVYDITETPSFVLIENGELKDKHEGFLDADGLVAFAHGELQ